MKALVTGNKGFVGQHLTEALNKKGIEVIGYDIKEGLDITSPNLKHFVESWKPDYIFHLAAKINAAESFDKPLEYMATNVGGTINLLEAAKNINANILLASSTEVYSPAIDDTPLDITSVTQPQTPYGVSKLTMEQMGAIYANRYKMHIVVTRTNNHTGPGQDGPFALTSFAKQIVEIERGRRDVLEHGDLSNFKSYLDVRDVVQAYITAIDLSPYIYNVTSDDSYEMGDLLNRLVAYAKVPITRSQNTSLVRSYKAPQTFYKPSSRLKDAGWKIEYPLERTLYDLLEYWRRK